MTQVEWKTSCSASALHAANAVATHRLSVDNAIGSILGPSPRTCKPCWPNGFPTDPGRGWRLLIGLACDVENNRSLAEQWLRRMRLSGANEATRTARLAERSPIAKRAWHWHFLNSPNS